MDEEDLPGEKEEAKGPSESEPPTPDQTQVARRVIPRNIEDEMKESYIDYSMSVIIGRALPDARDGLKPVHRRILYAMNQLGLHYNKSYAKSATVVGRVLGDYHPHGDSAVYDSMVRMAQDFSLRYPLVDGQGNFGSVDGDSAAAYRYTEARMSRIAEELLTDIDKDTVDFTPNYNDTLEEPTVLPARIPNLLINGSSGIAVGMATNMPPHNLSEVIDGTVAAIDNPDITIQELMQHIKGPDFPTGAQICGQGGIIQAYTTGRGSIRLRAKADIIEHKNHERIIINEIPYQINKANLVSSIADLVKNKKIEGISDLRDESDRRGMRIVIDLKSGVQGDIALNQLYKHTALEATFGVINLALVDNKPVVLTLKGLINNFINHRVDVITRRSQYELDKSEARLHILEGFRIALSNIDEVVKLIRGSKDADEAKNGLIGKFNLSEEQAKAILDMRLQRLTGLERDKIDQEHGELVKYINWLKGVLADKAKILQIVKDELLEIKEKHGDERKSEITEAVEDIELEDLIPEERMVVSITNQGYIKRLAAKTYRAQKRGGRGIKGMDTKDDDFVESLFVASTHDYMLFFTDRGKVYWLKVYQLPVAGRYSKGSAIVNLLRLEKDERINAAIKISEFTEGYYLAMITKKGLIKKTDLKAYSRPRKGGIIAINLREGDDLVRVLLTDGEDEILVSTKNGKAIRFSEKDARPLGRNSMGVKAIKLKKGDEVVGAVVVDEDTSLLTVTENGYGKRTIFDKYSTQRRGGQGVIDIKTTKRNGPVVAIRAVHEEDEIMSITSKGIIIRTPVSGISEIGRNTQGVRIMKLDEGNKVVSIARIVGEEEEKRINGEMEAEEKKAEEGKEREELYDGEKTVEGPMEEIEEITAQKAVDEEEVDVEEALKDVQPMKKEPVSERPEQPHEDKTIFPKEEISEKTHPNVPDYLLRYIKANPNSPKALKVAKEYGIDL